MKKIITKSILALAITTSISQMALADYMIKIPLNGINIIQSTGTNPGSGIGNGGTDSGVGYELVTEEDSVYPEEVINDCKTIQAAFASTIPNYAGFSSPTATLGDSYTYDPSKGGTVKQTTCLIDLYYDQSKNTDCADVNSLRYALFSDASSKFSVNTSWMMIPYFTGVCPNQSESALSVAQSVESAASKYLRSILYSYSTSLQNTSLENHESYLIILDSRFPFTDEQKNSINSILGSYNSTGYDISFTYN